MLAQIFVSGDRPCRRHIQRLDLPPLRNFHNGVALLNDGSGNASQFSSEDQGRLNWKGELGKGDRLRMPSQGDDGRALPLLLRDPLGELMTGTKADGLPLVGGDRNFAKVPIL